MYTALTLSRKSAIFSSVSLSAAPRALSWLDTVAGGIFASTGTSALNVAGGMEKNAWHEAEVCVCVYTSVCVYKCVTLCVSMSGCAAAGISLAMGHLDLL
jgi:hypothetical protein